MHNIFLMISEFLKNLLFCAEQAKERTKGATAMGPSKKGDRVQTKDKKIFKYIVNIVSYSKQTKIKFNMNQKVRQ